MKKTTKTTLDTISQNLDALKEERAKNLNSYQTKLEESLKVETKLQEQLDGLLVDPNNIESDEFLEVNRELTNQKELTARLNKLKSDLSDSDLLTDEDFKDLVYKINDYFNDEVKPLDEKNKDLERQLEQLKDKKQALLADSNSLLSLIASKFYSGKLAPIDPFNRTNKNSRSVRLEVGQSPYKTQEQLDDLAHRKEQEAIEEAKRKQTKSKGFYILPNEGAFNEAIHSLANIDNISELIKYSKVTPKYEYNHVTGANDYQGSILELNHEIIKIEINTIRRKIFFESLDDNRTAWIDLPSEFEQALENALGYMK